ncbi:MAG: CBS domain-containing protein [Candidatus Aminicenantes bacterium]|nr:CBS domain-containing protein [Candidatus Aminicenantes bacterium]
MRHSWKIARIFGIDIYIDSSWFIIFILFTWVLASSYYPERFPEWSAGQNWILGAFTALLLFGSVLIHELSHSLVAIQQGEEVRSITLFILGGVAQISGEPKQPLKEFVMALAGPFASLVMASLFLMLNFVLHTFSRPLAAAMFYLFLLNVALACFNLLPGFPMDGGRILRSVIWQITGDLEKATKIASRVGQGFAFFFIFLGVLQIINGSLSGFWLIFIGWFLHTASVRGYTQVVFNKVLKGMQAKDLMVEDFETVFGGMSVQDLVDEYILKKRERVFMVSYADKLEGIVCLEDVKALARDNWPQTPVREIMTPREKLQAVSPDADGNSVLQSLTAKDVHQVPVMVGDEVIGIICRTDLLRTIKLHSEMGK